MAKHLNKEMDSLKIKLMDTASLVEDSINKAILSILERDTDLAKEVIKQDDDIDNKEVDVEEECLKILALYQPVATDLRYIVAILKVNNDLERMGDLAVNISEYALSLAKADPLTIKFDFSAQAQRVQNIVRKSLESLTSMDSTLAYKTLKMDEEIDSNNREAFKNIQQVMQDDAKNIKRGVYLLSCSRQLERIADYATNIAEDVIYMVEGEVVRHRISASDLIEA